MGYKYYGSGIIVLHIHKSRDNFHWVAVKEQPLNWVSYQIRRCKCPGLQSLHLNVVRDICRFREKTTEVVASSLRDWRIVVGRRNLRSADLLPHCPSLPVVIHAEAWILSCGTDGVEQSASSYTCSNSCMRTLTFQSNWSKRICLTETRNKNYSELTWNSP